MIIGIWLIYRTLDVIINLRIPINSIKITLVYKAWQAFILSNRTQ